MPTIPGIVPVTDLRKDAAAALKHLQSSLEALVNPPDQPGPVCSGLRDSDLDRIVKEAGIKNNPIPLNEEEIKDLLLMRL